MAKLNNAEKSMVKSLMTDDRWNLIMKLLGNRIDDLRAEEVIGTNAFETLRSLHLRDGKVAGLLEFFDNIERGVFDD